mmetsp:Transcript_23992/g.43867  ORF Transcript_23992/g.43867 Transcript_23992/m.43867 type:complete len:201 (-) Transcript_23992:625-1227(-)
MRRATTIRFTSPPSPLALLLLLPPLPAHVFELRDLFSTSEASHRPCQTSMRGRAGRGVEPGKAGAAVSTPVGKLASSLTAMRRETRPGACAGAVALVVVVAGVLAFNQHCRSVRRKVHATHAGARKHKQSQTVAFATGRPSLARGRSNPGRSRSSKTPNMVCSWPPLGCSTSYAEAPAHGNPNEGASLSSESTMPFERFF